MNSVSWNQAGTRRLTLTFLAACAAWGILAWAVIPAIIRSAYVGGVFGFLSFAMAARDQLGVDVYLATWTGVSLRVFALLLGTWGFLVLLVQPAVRAGLRRTFGLVPTLGGKIERVTMVVVVLLLTLTVLLQAKYLPERWETAQGHEYQRIATSIMDGEGFSFPPGRRWLYLDSEPASQEYGATAWKEPLYPYVLAGAFSVLGDRYGRLTVVLMQAGCVFLAALFTFHVGSIMFGPVVGVVASLATVCSARAHVLAAENLSVPSISALLLIAGLFLLLRSSEDLSYRRAIVLGLFWGVAALVHAVLIVMIPIAVMFLIAHRQGRSPVAALRPALLMGVVAASAIAPWTVRNYVEFGHLIPVQTGFGLFANVSSGYVAETYVPDVDACGDGSSPVYQAEGPLDAVRKLRQGTNFQHVWERGVACVAAAAGPAYFGRNEHERDKLHQASFRQFIREHPGTFLELSAAKALVYLVALDLGSPASTPAALLASLGVLVLIRRRRVWVLPVAIAAYALPFILTAPLYPRYRVPLDPLFYLLAAATLVVIVRGLVGWMTRRWPDLDAEQRRAPRVETEVVPTA